MMDYETTTLLALVASFDNRTIDEARTAAWHSILRNVNFEDAKQVIYSMLSSIYHERIEYPMPFEASAESTAIAPLEPEISE